MAQIRVQGINPKNVAHKMVGEKHMRGDEVGEGREGEVGVMSGGNKIVYGEGEGWDEEDGGRRREERL